MQDTLHNLHTSISIGRPLCNLRFVDNVDLIGGCEAELQDLTTRLRRTARAYIMEVSFVKSKMMLNKRTLNAERVETCRNGKLQVHRLHLNKGWQLNKRGEDKTRPRRDSHYETQRHLEDQLHQLSSKVGTVQVHSCLHPVIRMRNLGPHCRSGENHHPGIRDHMLQNAPAHLIHRAQEE